MRNESDAWKVQMMEDCRAKADALGLLVICNNTTQFNVTNKGDHTILFSRPMDTVFELYAYLEGVEAGMKLATMSKR
jgi:hypothetical protein